MLRRRATNFKPVIGIRTGPVGLDLTKFVGLIPFKFPDNPKFVSTHRCEKRKTPKNVNALQNEFGTVISMSNDSYNRNFEKRRATGSEIVIHR